jgi:hypothetical protein
MFTSQNAEITSHHNKVDIMRQFDRSFARSNQCRSPIVRSFVRSFESVLQSNRLLVRSLARSFESVLQSNRSLARSNQCLHLGLNKTIKTIFEDITIDNMKRRHSSTTIIHHLVIRSHEAFPRIKL